MVGRVPGWSNAYVATGHGAEGLLLGPFSASVLAGQMLGTGHGGTGGPGSPPGTDVPGRMLERWSPGRPRPEDGT